jgi:riboflavin transporter FmnP
MGMMAAMACLVMLVRIPVMPAAPFLTYDPKDVIVVIGGFMFGPLAAVTLAAVSALVEMVTVSETGWWGFLMNFISSTAFAVPAALVYKFRRTLAGAVVGLAVGLVTVVPVMLLMNLLVVPLFMLVGPPHDRFLVPRADVAAMLLPVFLPFNAIKYSLNGAVALIVYKPVVNALAAAGLFRPPAEGGKKSASMAVLVGVGLLILGLAATILIIQVTR